MINLPKKDKNGVPYLSYSQISTWKKSKRDYIRQYFLGETFKGNAYTQFGSLIGNAIEKNDYSAFTKDEIIFLKTIPRLDEFEKEIKLNFNGFYVKGFIDTNSLKDNYVERLIDYKTGDIDKKKSEYDSDDYMQTVIYASAIKQATGRIPKKCDVVLIGRSGNPFKGEDLKLTKEFIVIPKKVGLNEIKKVNKSIEDVAKEISKYYTLFLKLNKKL